jgi:hypothetical protein
MVSDISRQGKYHKHIRIHLPFEKRDQFMMNVPNGLYVTLYAPIQQDERQWVDPDEVNITVVANAHEPDPQYRKHKEDVDQFLATINTVDDRIRIITEDITEKEQPNLIKDWFVKQEVMLDHPGLDGELDHLRSKAANIHDIELTESQKDSLKAKNAKETAKRDPITNEKIYAAQQGEM